MTHALIVVDVQRDFCEGGALAAADTLSLLTLLCSFVATARHAGVKIVFTQDWHPPNHSSFRAQGGHWPVHCVADSRGAELMPPLAAEPGDLLARKGQTVDGAGYSGFENTQLAEQLKALGVKELAVCGVATEYCVRATAIDAAQAAFRVTVLTDLIRPVDASAVADALRDMAALGIKEMNSQSWLSAARSTT
jgi:nicotinamidase/pyrazinamidase